jgi:hypothetical protein
MTVLVFRGIGHPWTAAPGWDQMMLAADDGSLDTLRVLIERAKQKFWRVWFMSEPTLKCHMFKPSDATRDWKDISWQGTPRGHGHAFKVGEAVYTDFSGRITHHRITHIEFSKMSQTGVRFRLAPPVPGSEFVADDPGRGPKVHGTVLIDSAWFRKVEP